MKHSSKHFVARLSDIHDPVSKTVRKLCKDRGPRSWLERSLVMVSEGKFPIGRRLKVFTKGHKDALENATSNLDAAAGVLERLIVRDKKRYKHHDEELRTAMPLFTRESKVLNTNISFEDVPGIVRCLSGFLQTLLTQDVNNNNFETPNARSFLPHFIEEIRETTGKPHFKELAFLLNAAYGYKKKITANWLRQLAR